MAGARPIAGDKGVVLAGDARWRLTRLWFAWTAVLFVTLVVQSVMGYYGNRITDAWSWFVPLVSPTLAAMVGVFVSERRQRGIRRQKANPQLFQLTYWLSLAYLATITFTIYIGPFAWRQSQMTPLELMKLSHLWLLPVQALVIGSLGAWFAAVSDPT